MLVETVGIRLGFTVGLKNGLLVGKKVGLRDTGMDDGFLLGMILDGLIEIDGNRVGSTEGKQDGSTLG